jgi:hypothetical protein
MEMTKLNGLIKPNTKIFLGIGWFGIAIIYIADRFLNGMDIRLFDWIGWIAMFSAGAISIIEGISIKKSNSK